MLVCVCFYLQRREDASEGSSKHQEHRDGRQLTSVTVTEVRGRLDQLRKTHFVSEETHNSWGDVLGAEPR